MSGGVVLELARVHPNRIRSIVLGATCVFPADKPRPSRLMHLLYYVPFRFYATRAKAQLYGSSAPKEAIDRDIEMLAKDKFQPRGVIAQAQAISRYFPTLEDVSRTNTPALVLHGTEDKVVPYEWAEELARTLPDARLVAVIGGGHSYIVSDLMGPNSRF